jgi:hypothetical protein
VSAAELLSQQSFRKGKTVMRFSMQVWGLGVLALALFAFTEDERSVRADEVLPPPVDGAVGSPTAGPAGAIGAALDAVGVAAAPVAGPAAGPAAAGPVDGVPVDGIGGGPIAGAPIDGAVPPPGPALVHHFVSILRIPLYGGVRDLRSELLLYADNTFQMLLPNDGWGPGFCRGGLCGGPGPAPAGPITLLGTWCLNGDELQLTYNDGWMDFGLMTIAPTGPRLRFQGRRWADILAIAP